MLERPSEPPPPHPLRRCPKPLRCRACRRRVQRGLKQELAGIQGQGEAAQQQAKQESAAYEQRQQGLQKMQADMEGQMAAHTARVEKLQTDILNGKIDPTASGTPARPARRSPRRWE
jgi:anti-sigma28 factor (negative regulator of flagellin synthesis)